MRDDLGIDDQDRMLTTRGREDAARLGHFLSEAAHIPDLVLCSPAARTRETLESLLPELGARPAVQYLSELYLAKPPAILAVIRRTRKAIGSLMIVGHNPGVENCARELVREPVERKMHKTYLAMRESFPTSALVVIDFAGEHWRRIGAGELKLFVRPKDLRNE